MFDRFVKRGTRQLSRFAGVSVTYLRGNTSAALKAVPGSTPFRVDTEQQFNVMLRSVDFLIHRTESVTVDDETSTFDAVFGEPQRKDRIQRIVGGERLTYELLPFGDEPEWRPAGVAGELLRCHTRLVKREDVA